MPSSTITGIATGNPDFSILVSALQYLDSTLGSNLVATLDDPHANLTVFAPTNTAFSNLAGALGYSGDASDLDAVTGFLVENVPAETLLDVVTYHVSPGIQPSYAIAAHPTISTLNGATISADLPTLVDNEPDLIDPSLTSVDNWASNGIVHVIDQVLLPIDLPGNDAPSITEIVASSGDGFDGNKKDFDILLAAVTAAGLDGVLDDATLDATVFAPIDGAFIKLAQALGFEGSDEGGAWGYLVDALTLLGGGDPIPLLTQILTYHVAGESLQASQVLSAGHIETLQGGTLRVDGDRLVDAEPDVANPRIIDTDIQAENGVVHVLNGVLLPIDVLESDGSHDVDFVMDDNGSHTIKTGADNDYVYGKGGHDKIVTRDGHDVAMGGDGNDYIGMGKGNDLGLGGKGSDTIYGHKGRDELKGEGGHDKLYGGDGRDILEGGKGKDMMIGGRGEDIFVFHAGDDKDRIQKFETDKDMIDLSSYGMDGMHELEHGMKQFSGGTKIGLGNGDHMFLEDVSMAQLDADNFIF